MFNGIPGKPGCMVVMYKCGECDCIPVVDLNWSVTNGHGQGSGWWCTKCGEMWDGYQQGSYLLGIQLNGSVDSVHYFQTTPPPQECTSFIEVRKFATNAMNLNLPFTEGATDSLFAQQLIDFVKRDNQLAALSTPDLAACVVISRTVGPNVDQSKHLPNYKLIEDPGSFTLKKDDWNREERFYDLDLLPEAKKNPCMPESDWPGLCNMVFEALTIAVRPLVGVSCARRRPKSRGEG